MRCRYWIFNTRNIQETIDSLARGPYYPLFERYVFMRVSAAIPRGRPPGTQGHLSQLPWQIHAKAPRVGQKIGTNTPTPGATWATYSRCCLFLDAKVRVIMVYWSHISTKIHTSLYGVLKFELSGANFLGLRLFITLSLPIGKTLRMRTNRMKLKSRCRFP